jgi:hypothetical protein
MEKKILYICLIIISAYSIYQKVNYNSKKYIFDSLISLKECIELEDLFKGKVIDNIKISKYNDKENYLYNILSEFSTEYYLIIISSIEACSTCKEQILNMWNDLYKKNKNIPILLIVSEQEELTKDEIRQIHASIKGLKIEIPFYFDHESILLDNIGVSPYHTPISIILTHDKKIIAIDRASEYTKKRTMNLKEFFLLLNSNGG